MSVRYLAKQHGLPRTMLDSLDTIKMINDISSHLKRKKYNLTLRYLGKVENSGFEIKKDLYLNNIRFDKCEKKLGNCLKIIN